MYEIRKDVPVPEIAPQYHGRKYPFAKMEPGDSFLIPHDQLPEKGLDSVRAAVGVYRRVGSYAQVLPDGKKLRQGGNWDRKFRVVESEAGIEVWRTE